MSKIIQSAYSSIGAQKYKKAATLLESPEVARYPIAKSLKCYCYVQLGNRQKVKESIEEVIKLKPTDSHVILQTMDAIHYVGDYTLAIRLLEEAHKNDKHNIETGELLYYSYFWMKEFDKMRDLSLDLMKLYKVKMYSIWNAANVIFNTTPEDPEKYKKVMLLSEMMIRNQIKAVDVKSREGRCYQWLLIEILLREGKFEDAEKEVNERMESYVVSQRLLDDRILHRHILHELNREKEIIPLLEHDIETGKKSDWDAILYYMDTVCELIDHDDAMSSLTAFETKYCKTCETREKWLYKLELASRKGDKNVLVDLITHYVDYIGHKQCCYPDLERWLPMIREDTESISVMTKYIINILNLTICVTKGKDLLDVIQKKMTVLQVAIYLGIPINESFLEELYKTYCIMIPQYKETLSSKEILSLDYIPFLLAILLHNKALQPTTSPIDALYCHCEAIALLEKHKSERPHFFLSTLALCLLYYQMGVPLEAIRCYSQLDIKEIQMMSMCGYLEPICREWSLVKDTREQFSKLNLFLANGLKESHQKQGECLKEGTFINIQTMRELGDRLQNSREGDVFKILFYLNSLTASIKEPDCMNQSCFEDLVHPLNLLSRRNNLDYSITRFWNMSGTEFNQMKKQEALSEYSAFEEAIACFFCHFMESNNQLAKVDVQVIDSVVNSINALKAKVNSLSVYSYCIVGEVLRMLQAGEVGNTEETVQQLLDMMNKELLNMQRDGIYNVYCLNQLNLVMNRSAIWLELLLSKNKKCSKPSPAKEPTAGLIVRILNSFFAMTEFEVSKKSYASLLEETKLVKGRFVESVKKVSETVFANHNHTITQIKTTHKDIQNELTKKNYRLKMN